MSEPATPGDAHGADDAMEDRSQDGDHINLEDVSATADAESRAEKANGRGWVEADEPTNYSLYMNPPNLGHIRQRLFDIDDSIEMSASDFEAYFPFVDNIWRKNKGDAGGESSTTSEIYWCRLKKSSAQKPYTPKPTPEGKTARKKRTREEKACPMAIKIVHKDRPVKSCTITRAVGPEVRHSHDLDYMDNMKRNSGVMDIARREAIKGFLPGSVYWKMQEEQDKLIAAGGKFLKISDVRNVQYAWRQENFSMTLKAHQGYSQSGRGPKPRLSSPAVPPRPAATATMHHPSPAVPPPLVASAPPAYLEPARHALQYPHHAREFLEPYLPQQVESSARTRPHVTLTWATSLDARISLMPGVQTALSGPETKAMTHYLRSRHDAILIGVRTAITDDPSLNCRLAGAGGYGGPHLQHQPRPIIIDPHARLHIRPEMKILRAVAEGHAKGPWVVILPGVNLHPTAVSTLKQYGGEYLMIQDVNPQDRRFNWEGIFEVLYKEGIKSVMVEGGGVVLSELLGPRYATWVDSVVLTIAPTFLGRAGVEVSPHPSVDHHQRPITTRLSNVRWQPMGDSDVVMCGHMKADPRVPNGMLPGIAEFSQHPPEPKDGKYAPAQNGHGPSVRE